MKKHRILCLALVLSLVLSIVPVTAAAASVTDFTDVVSGSWYYDYVDYVTREGYFLGKTATTFEPGQTMTRAQFVMVLSRMAGAELDNSVSPFKDVPANSWCAGAVKWASDNGIVTGRTDGTFDPNGAVTRQQMCAFMDRYITWYSAKTGKTPYTVNDPATFGDEASISGYAKEAVKNCQTWGLVLGFKDGNFYPQRNSTRAQVAAVIARLAWVTSGGAAGIAPASSYTITYFDGTEKLGSDTTESNYVSEKAFTTREALADKTVTAEDGTAATYVFTGWKDEAGNLYAAETKYTATGNLNLYAQWVNTEDLIGMAVKKSIDQYNTDAAAAMAKAASYTSGAYKYVSMLAGNVSVAPAVFNGDPEFGRDEERTQTVTGSASVGSDLAVQIMAAATADAVKLLGPDYSKSDVKAVLTGVVADVKTELGITGALSDKTLDDITDAVYTWAADQGTDYRDLFKVDGSYVTGNVTITANGRTVTVTVSDTDGVKVTDKVAAAKTLASGIAREMYANLKKNTTWTSKVTLEAVVTVKFSASDVYGTQTNPFPYTYPVKVGLTLDGGDVVQYQFANNKSNLKVTVTEELQKAYAADVDQVVVAALNNATVKKELTGKVENTVNTFSQNSTFGALIKAMGQLGMTESAAKARIDEAMRAWAKANMGAEYTATTTGTGDEATTTYAITDLNLVGSPLYKVYWEQDEDASYQNAAIYALVKAVADDAAKYVDDELIKILTKGLSEEWAKTTAEGLRKTASPKNLKETLTDNNISLGLDDYPAIETYVLSVISDYMNGKVGVSNNYTASAESAMKASVDKLVRDALEGTDYYGYLQSAIKVQNVDTLATVQLGSLANLLTNSTFQNAVAKNAGADMLNYIQKAVKMLPAGASVELNGVTLNQASLGKVQNANDLKGVCNALAELLKTEGLSGLSISSFAGGQDITVRYNSRTFTFNLAVEVEAAKN